MAWGAGRRTRTWSRRRPSAASARPRWRAGRRGRRKGARGLAGLLDRDHARTAAVGPRKPREVALAGEQDVDLRGITRPLALGAEASQHTHPAPDDGDGH